MKHITIEWLKKKNACEEGKAWFLNQKETELSEVIKRLIKAKKYDWANWAIVRFMTHIQRIQYACYAAKQSLHFFKKKFPKDKRPRKAIQAALKYVKNPTEVNRLSARSAAYSARSAAYSARSAADAAESAAYSARSARSAADAAYSAAYSAESTADAAESAADAAYSARSAADAAADAAYSAAYSAYSAAYSAAVWSSVAESAAYSTYSAAWKKILAHGLKLCK